MTVMLLSKSSVQQYLTAAPHPRPLQHTCELPCQRQRATLYSLLARPSQRWAPASLGRLHRRAVSAAVPAFQPGASSSHSAALRELADCYPGCSRACWIEGPELSGSASAATALSAAALAEPSAEPDADAAKPSSAAPDNNVTRIYEPEELTNELASHDSELVVLMCKAHSCRPCKMFTRKYQRLAEAYPQIHFLEIYGRVLCSGSFVSNFCAFDLIRDDTKETRKLMISMGIKVTPNFRLYRNKELVHQLAGVNETNLRNALEEY